MNVKKAVKRIAALAAGTTMVTATIMGATADLGAYPEPFVSNGVFNGKLVIGKTAQVSDVLGAIDIAASLQAASKTAVETSGTSTEVTVDGGVEIKQGSSDLNLGDPLDDFNSGKYDDDDFPELLKSGTLEDDDGSDYDYDQYIYIGDAAVAFGQDDDEGGDMPVYHIDWGSANEPYLNFTIDFDDDANITALTDSETIDMFGKTYTFDANNGLDDDLVMYGSDVTTTISQDEPVTIEVDGTEYTIEVLGGNSDDATAIIRVTGSGQSTKTLEKGDSRTMAGLDVYIDDVFISNIGANTISVSLFVGSNKIVIPKTAVSTSASWKEIEINDEDNTGVYAWVESHSDNNLGDIETINFGFDLTDFKNPRTNDDWDWMIAGDRFTDDLFGFSVYYDGYTPEMDGRDEVKFTRSSDTYSIDFQNNDGDDYSLELYQYSSGVTYGDDLRLSGGNTLTTALEDKDIFILEEDGQQREDAVTKVYEVVDINGDDSEVTLKELGSGASKVYKLSDQIDDAVIPGTSTPVTIATVASDDDNFTISSAVLSEIVFKDGANLTLDTNMTDGANLTYYEDSDDVDEATAGSFDFAFYHGSSTDEDIQLSFGSDPWGSNGVAATDTDGDVRYAVSDYGTWVEGELDNDGDYLKIYSAPTETAFHAFIEGPDAVVVKTGASSGSTYYQINDMVVGQIAVYDTEAASLLGNTPLIVVGGPCVNTIAMDLMGNPTDCAEGFVAGKGKIKLFSDKNALLVAGYSAQDTVGASYVLADYDKYDLSGDEVEVIVTDLNNIEVQSVA